MIVLLLAALSSISSDQVEYNGTGLKLSGQVIIEHPLGKMEAQEALLDKPSGKTDESFNEIHLMNTVRIALKDHGQIVCEKADFDLTTLKGSLEAKKGEKIEYFNQLSDKQPLELHCQNAELQFETIKQSAPLLNSILALGAVEIIYGDGFHLYSEAADFSKSSLIASSPSGTPCRLSHGDDHLEADRLQLFPKESKIAIQHPKGKFRSLGLTENSSLSFECDELIWDQDQKLIHFQSKVVIDEPTVGRAEALEGNAKFVESSLSTFELLGDVLLTKGQERLARSDTLTYSDATQTVVLKANPGERVLFFDREKGLTISATEVHISKDPLTSEEKVKGVGNVRFHLSSSEAALLKKLFPGYIIPEAHDNFAG